MAHGTCTSTDDQEAGEKTVENLDYSVVRSWAQKEGLPVGTRGRIRPEIVAAYILAHGGQAPASPPKPGPIDESKHQALPMATPGVAESFGDDAGAVAKNYVPGADRQDLTDALIDRARAERAAIVAVGPALKLYRNSQPPQGSAILLDFRESQ